MEQLWIRNTFPGENRIHDTVTYTEKEIIMSHYDSWQQKMIKKYGEHWKTKLPVTVTAEQACIQDWAIENWAWKI